MPVPSRPARPPARPGARLPRIVSTAAWCLVALLATALSPPLHAQADDVQAAPAATLDDGPYVFRVDGSGLEALWVCAGEMVRVVQPPAAGRGIAPRCGFPHPAVVPSALADPESVDLGDRRIVALSDIHGQYDLMLRLLRAHAVIDDDDNWSLGRDHLVITGDVFDRGPQVNEVFWMLFRLQQQAHEAGGAVHFLLGNHETMVLYGDLRYIHPRYVEVARVLGRSYPDLYGADSVIGGWLRTRPVLLKLGDTLFLHGGIAPESLDLVERMDETNAAYRASLGVAKGIVQADPATARLYSGKRSPIWYRGYFNGDLSTQAVEALVDRLGLARIVVGHTTMDEVVSFHEGRIVAIDSGIKRGQSGQLLFIDGGQLSRGLLDGSREPVPARHAAPEDKD